MRRQAFTSSSVNQQFPVVAVEKLSRRAASAVAPQMRPNAVLQRAQRATLVTLKVIKRQPHCAHLAFRLKVKVGGVAVESKRARARRLYPHLQLTCKQRQ